MARCGCGGGCTCVVQAHPDCSNVEVTGIGSSANPYQICVTEAGAPIARMAFNQLVPTDTIADAIFTGVTWSRNFTLSPAAPTSAPQLPLEGIWQIVVNSGYDGSMHDGTWCHTRILIPSGGNETLLPISLRTPPPDVTSPDTIFDVITYANVVGAPDTMEITLAHDATVDVRVKGHLTVLYLGSL